MSAVNFNDYVSYPNYDTSYDFSALVGGAANPSSNLLSDYASIKNGSYGKLLKATLLCKTGCRKRICVRGQQTETDAYAVKR